MSQVSPNPPESEKIDLNELRLRCHRKIDAIARRPGAAKLLQLAEKALTLYEKYKANRDHDDRA